MTKRRSDVQGVAGAVLAGGEARRMGGSKAAVRLAGRPLITYPIAALRKAGLDPFVVTKPDRPVSEVPGLESVPVVLEPDEPRHPLVGVLAALEHAAGCDLIVLACDLPLLTPEYLRMLAIRPGEVVIPRVGGRWQPLAARYGPGTLDAVRRGAAGNRSIREVIRELEPMVIEEHELRRFGDPDRMFENVNTPEDLRRVERLRKP